MIRFCPRGHGISNVLPLGHDCKGRPFSLVKAMFRPRHASTSGRRSWPLATAARTEVSVVTWSAEPIVRARVRIGRVTPARSAPGALSRNVLSHRVVVLDPLVSFEQTAQTTNHRLTLLRRLRLLSPSVAWMCSVSKDQADSLARSLERFFGAGHPVWIDDLFPRLSSCRIRPRFPVLVPGRASPRRSSSSDQVRPQGDQRIPTRVGPLRLHRASARVGLTQAQSAGGHPVVIEMGCPPQASSSTAFVNIRRVGPVRHREGFTRQSSRRSRLSRSTPVSPCESSPARSTHRCCGDSAAYPVKLTRRAVACPLSRRVRK